MKNAPARRPRDDHRREQLRIAKQAQRDREAGLVLCQLKVRPDMAERLRRAVAAPGFEAALVRFIDEALIDTAAYPNLALLCWNRRDRYIAGRDALALYERNWRFVDEAALEPRVQEGHIDLRGETCPAIPVPCLARARCFAERFLANADLGADAAMLSRDVIDLAFMLQGWGDALTREGAEIARAAYGEATDHAARAAAARLLEHRAELKRCAPRW